MLIRDLYDDGVEVPLRDVHEHTMQMGQLSKYVKSKFSQEQIDQLRAAYYGGDHVRVTGVYKSHINDYLEANDFEHVMEWKRPATSSKMFNVERPILIKAKRKNGHGVQYFLFVFPSPEYVKQYAELVLKVFSAQQHDSTRKPIDHLKCITYGKALREFPEWSGLCANLRNFVEKDDMTIIGHVDLMNEFFKKDEPQWPEVLRWTEFGVDNLFSACIHQDKSHGRAVLLGVRESFWGSAAGVIARALSEAGSSHIVYVAKMGVLSTPEKIHSIMSPSKYYIWAPLSGIPEGCVTEVNHSRSPMHVWPVFKKYISGAHLSVPTVVGETFEQQKSYINKGITSIDNEISYIAQALSATTSMFTALHFVTDYVRNEFSKNYEAPHDLTSSRETTTIPKHKQFREISILIKQYATTSLHKNEQTDVSLVRRKVKIKRMTWPTFQKAVQHLSSKIMENPVHGGFRPDVVVGVNTGGAIVGGLLYLLNRGRFSFSTIWNDKEHPVGRELDLHSLRTFLETRPRMKLLLVDDSAKTGSSLMRAVRSIKSADLNDNIDIKSAVLVFRKDLFSEENGQRPDYYIYDDFDVLPYARV